ncbi:hypothetical protein [Streptomyces sp. NPDC046860]|uniref:hypothetical protein n=1 Tax=Streptomyces sp. NPDC046860 TaxID=3154495 RepID=UPI0033F8906F
MAALRRGRHRRGRRVVLLLAGAAVLALAVSSLVRIAPDAGPGTAEAEPRRPWKLGGAGPSPEVSATVVAVPSASTASASGRREAGPAPSGTVTAGTEATSAPTGGTVRPSAAATGVPQPPPAPHTPATPHTPTEAPAPPPQAPPPAPTRSSAPPPTPPPESKGVCVPVLGLCLELRGG